MLKALHLGNFKAFGSPAARMPIRPITLIFGPNSGGKSSLIHGLVLGHEALFKRRFDIHRAKLGGNSIDLGGFRQYVHRRDPDRVVTWGAEIELSEHDANEFGGNRLLMLSAFGRGAANKSTRGVKPRLLSHEVRIGDEQWLKMVTRGNGRLQLDGFSDAFKRIGQTLSPMYPSDASEYEKAIDILSFPSDGLSPRSPQALLPSGAPDKNSPWRSFPGVVGMAMTTTMMLHGTLKDALSRLNYLGPLRSLPPRHLAFTDTDDVDAAASGRRAWDRMRQSKELRDAVNRWLDSEERLHTRYRLERRQYIAPRTAKRDIIAALDKMKKRLFNDREVAEKLLAESEGDVEAELPDAEERWDRDEFVKVVADQLLHNRSGDGDADLVLVDKMTNTTVSHRDVGIGISQVLPVLVEAYGNENRLVAIEQPEIHLHPRLQSELADVFLESALGTKKNTFLLETHSEHIMLRVMRRIRESNEGKLLHGQIKITPEDVAVLYVEPDGNGAKIIEIPLTEDGELGAPWPGGFFDDRMKELFES